MTNAIQIKIEEMNQRKIIRLQGKIDALTTPVLESKILPLLETEKKILMDFSKVDYLSSAGMRFLLTASRKLKGKGGILVVFGLNEEVTEIIKMSGFDRILTLCPNELAALKVLEKNV